MLETIERMEAVTSRRSVCSAKCRQARDVEGRNIYLCSPEYMATYARRFILHNVRIIGGCCGTTPEHVRQIKAAVRRPGAGDERTGAAVQGAARRASAIAAPPVPREKKSRFAAELARGTFVVAAELLPPRGFEAESAIRARGNSSATAWT